MANANKRKGDSAEREIATRLATVFRLPIRRKLGAGRKDDTGDIDGLPDWTLQVKNRKDIARTIREGLPQLQQQQKNNNTPHAAMLCRQHGGTWIVIQTLDQWTAIVEATWTAQHSNGRYTTPTTDTA